MSVCALVWDNIQQIKKKSQQIFIRIINDVVHTIKFKHIFIRSKWTLKHLSMNERNYVNISVCVTLPKPISNLDIKAGFFLKVFP